MSEFRCQIENPISFSMIFPTLKYELKSWTIVLCLTLKVKMQTPKSAEKKGRFIDTGIIEFV